MGFWSRLWVPARKGAISTSLDLFREIYGGRMTRSGVSIDWKSALAVTTVLACCKVIAEGVAQVPWRLYQDKAGVKRVAEDHPLHRLLFRRPNRWQTSFGFRETIVFHTILCGNAYVYIGRAGSARTIRELVPIEPGNVSVERDAKTGRLTYRVRDPIAGESRAFPEETIWHLRGVSWNGWMGLEAIKMAAEAIGLAAVLEQSQADLQAGGAKIGGIVSVVPALGPERYEQLTAWIDRYIANGSRAGKPLILDNDAKFFDNRMTGLDAETLATRRMQVEEICRALRVMPIMVGQSDKTATYASAEQMFIAHVVHTLSPWYGRIEQSGDVTLLTEEEWAEQGYYNKFDPNALMRGAAKDQGEYWAKSLGSGGGWGWMTPNQIRALLDMNPLPNGDDLPQPIANAAPGQDRPTDEPPPKPSGTSET